MHIVVVEDEPDLLFLLGQALEGKGITVSAFERPEDALRAIRKADALVTDFHLASPIRGSDLAVEARRANPTIIIVIYTALVGSHHGIQAEPEVEAALRWAQREAGAVVVPKGTGLRGLRSVLGV